MVAALKARGIPVAGADRLRLTDQIAVQDLIALGDFLTLPEDDLALAERAEKPALRLSTMTTSWRSPPAARARCGRR